VAVKVGPLVLLLSIVVIPEYIMKRPVACIAEFDLKVSLFLPTNVDNVLLAVHLDTAV
jgi:hypothetical protein